MLRAPQIATCSGSLRPLLLREFHGEARSQPGRARDGRAAPGRVRAPEGGAALLTGTLSSPARKPSLNSDSLSQSPEAASLLDYLMSGTCLPSRRRLWDARPTSLSLTPKTGCYFQRAFSLLAAPLPAAGAFEHAHSKSFCVSLPRAAAATQAASGVTGAWSDCLSAENESRCRQSLLSNRSFYEESKERRWLGSRTGRAKWASVLVALCSVEGEPAVLFTLRSSKLKGRHKGDVSFAGGKNDVSDRDVVATALRETREELGITVSPESVWGTLKPLRDASAMMIAPVLANLGPVEDLSFKPNPEEVEEIFTLSLSHVCNPHNRGYTHFRTGETYGYTLPVFRNGKHRVWGLTATALDHALRLIVPRSRPRTDVVTSRPDRTHAEHFY